MAGREREGSDCPKLLKQCTWQRYTVMSWERDLTLKSKRTFFFFGWFDRCATLLWLWCKIATSGVLMTVSDIDSDLQQWLCYYCGLFTWTPIGALLRYIYKSLFHCTDIGFVTLAAVPGHWVYIDNRQLLKYNYFWVCSSLVGSQQDFSSPWCVNRKGTKITHKCSWGGPNTGKRSEQMGLCLSASCDCQHLFDSILSW